MEQTKRIDYWYITDPEKDWKGYPVTEVTDDPSYKLAKMCEKTTFADLPAADVERAKKAMLDTIACMMLGSTTGFVPAMVEAEKPFLTKGESKVFFYGNETTAIEAAVPNGSMASVAKYSDVHVTGGAVSEFIVPTLLTGLSLLKGKLGQTVNGKEFLTAYAVAAEWNVRHHSCMHYMDHANATPGNLGCIADGAAIGKLAGVDYLTLVNICGFNFCSNTWGEGESHVEECDARQVNTGIYASDALMGLLVAKDGLTSPTAFYFGKSGYLRYIVWDDIEPELLTRDLGKKWMWTKGLKYRTVAGTEDTALTNVVDELSWEQLEEKLAECAAHCKKQYTPAELSKIVALCKNMESVEDMTELTDLLV